MIEFELYVQIDDPPEDEPRGDCLIEGCTEFTNMLVSKPFMEHQSLYGERCALDVKYLVLMNAVEARVNIEVLHVGAIGVDMKLCAKTSGFSEVIQLFRGAAPEPGCVMSFVVAVVRYSDLDLYIEGSPKNDHVLGQEPLPVSWWQCSVGSGYHGTDEEVAKLDEFATFSVKVTWKFHLKKP
uniref:DUF6598 domain-containing protein n=1 Tax=Arundo donax TaxID=35708 RepID=A0A0A9DY41_ARUDO